MEEEMILNPITNRKVKSLIGDTFGRLKIIKLDLQRMKYRQINNKRSRTYWLCECSCGKEELVSVEVSQLLIGKTTSCGCFKRENTHNVRFKDLTNQKFGKLTVVELDKNRMSKEDNKTTYWTCQCECEKHSIVSVCSGSLINGNTKSCGCLNYESLQELYKQKAIKGNSFAQYLIDLYGEKALELYWSDKNTVNPWEINKSSSTIDIYLNCQEVPYHQGYKTTCDAFVLGGGCSFCHGKQIHPRDSFAQWCIDNIDKNFMNKYWSDRNIVDPFIIAKATKTKVWIKCQEKDYHEDYEIACELFYRGVRCPYCVNRKTHPKDSLGQYIVDKYGQDFLDRVWSDKNKKSAFEYAPNSRNIVWWKCESGKHEDYQRDITQSNKMRFRCPSCNNIKGELRIEEILRENNIKHILHHTFDGLLGVAGGLLSYDLYLNKYNLLIEYQGIQHFQPIEYFGGEKQFIQQQEHDKRKRNYAELNDINLLEIPYWDYDNIEEIILLKLTQLEQLQLNKAI